MEPLRIGLLGCGAVSDYAIFQPARSDHAITVAAVASRDIEKARAFADRHGVARAHGSYRALLADDTVEAVYIALPNGLHREWTIAALRAGRPVLCEKPMAANASEAAEMAAVARETRLPLVEAFHWRDHPLAARLRELVDGGAIGAVRRIEAAFEVPAEWLGANDIRRDAGLAGGSLMDQGCYCVSLLRRIARSEPRVIEAVAELLSPGVDGAMRAELRFPGEVSGSIRCSMKRAASDMRCEARVLGERGEIAVHNPFLPGLGGCITVATDGGERVERPTTVPSYVFQARAFAALVRSGRPDGNAGDAVAGMAAIDAIYRAAGMAPRGLC